MTQRVQPTGGALQTLLETAADPRPLGASIGFLAVLHTWGQNLHLHPHLHCVVPDGGISPDGSRWIACRKDSFFLPVRLLSHCFRKKFLRQLRQAFRHGELRFTGDLRSLTSPAAFEALCEHAAKIECIRAFTHSCALVVCMAAYRRRRTTGLCDTTGHVRGMLPFHGNRVRPVHDLQRH